MDIAKFHPLERVGLPDFKPATGELALIDQIRQRRVIDLPSGRTTGQASTSMRVLSGFSATAPTTTTVKITAGNAILSWLDGSTLYHGVLSGDQSPSDYTLDFSSESPGTYAIYARFVYSDSNTENRVFWNPAASPASEEVDNIATRKTATWEVTFQNNSLSDPGNGEWIKIWEATVIAGPTVSAVTDFRHFYFEGSAHTSDAYAHEWGDGTNDRNADRAAYGIGDWHMFAQMVRRQLKDLIDQDADTSYVSLPGVDMASLDDEHWGPTAPAGAQGKHKAINIGADGRFWNIDTETESSPDRQVIHLKETTYGENGEIAFATNPDGTECEFKIQQRGDGTAMNTGDSFSIRGASDSQFILKHQIQAADRQLTTISGSSSQEVEIHSGSGQARQGIHTKNGLWFAQNEQLRLFYPASKFQEHNGETTFWYLGGTAEAYSYFKHDGEAGATRRLILEIMDLPENATLDYIDVYWKQDVAASTADMRMYCVKNIMTRITNGYDATPSITQLSLKGTNNYITYRDTTTCPYNNVSLDRFACTNNQTFQRRNHESLHIAITTPNDSSGKNAWVYGVHVTFTYRWLGGQSWGQ